MDGLFKRLTHKGIPLLEDIARGIEDTPSPTPYSLGIRNGAQGISLGFIEIFDLTSGKGLACVYGRNGLPASYAIAKQLVSTATVARENQALQAQIEELLKERDQARSERDRATNLVHLYQEELGVWSCCGTALRMADTACPKCASPASA
jgi:hypothetical protein